MYQTDALHHACERDMWSCAGLLEGKTLEERLQEGNRLFQADYTHPFEDYIDRINAQKKAPRTTDIKWLTKNRVQHAGRALFYFTYGSPSSPFAFSTWGF